MNKNIHDDKLDDYVRKSFEGYEEEPPEEMWSRVEGGLNPSMTGWRSLKFFRRYTWQALAASVILLLFSALVCEHYYYQGKLKEMAVKTMVQQESTQQLPQTIQPESGKPSFQSTATPSGQANSNALTSGEFSKPQSPKLETNTKHISRISKTASPKTKANVEASVDPVLAEAHPELPMRNPASGSDNIPGPKMVEPVSKENQSTAEHTLPVSDQNADTKIAFLPIIPILLQQPGSQQAWSIPVSKPPLPFSIGPVSRSDEWFVGLHTSFLGHIEKTLTQTARPGRPVFTNEQKDTGYSTIWWLKTGKNLGARFTFETGFGYQKTSRTASHVARFRFGDGIHHGQMGTSRDYNYDLGTYGGNAEVSLRMEETDPGQPVTDTEPVVLRITTTERMELIRVPLQAGIRFGNTRLQGQLKAGILGNLILANELDLAARVSQNARFRPVVGREGYTVNISSKKFFLGYSCSAGASFKLNRHISLVAESTLIGDFPRNDLYKRPLPKQYLLGLNVGANYYF